MSFSGTRQLEFADYFHILVRRRWLLAAGAILGIASAIVWDQLATARYSVESSIDTSTLSENFVRAAILKVDGSLHVIESEPCRLQAIYDPPDPLTLRIVTKSPQAAARQLQEITVQTLGNLQYFAGQQGETARAEQRPLYDRLENTRQEIAVQQKRVESLQETLDALVTIRSQSAKWARTSPGADVLLRALRQIDETERALRTAESQLTTELPERIAITEREISALAGTAVPKPRIARSPDPTGVRVIHPVTRILIGLLLGIWTAVTFAFLLEYIHHFHRISHRSLAPAHQRPAV
jgi:hypothetical protein